MPYADKAKNDACKKRWAKKNKDYICKTSRRRYRERKEFNSGLSSRSSIGNVCRKLAAKTDHTAIEIEIWREETFIAQKGRCEICGAYERELKRRLCIDHNHKTGKLRALLCHNCNAAIGFLDDNPALCHQATKYLRKFNRS